MREVISDKAIERRAYWVEELRKISGNFVDDSGKLEKELAAEIENEPGVALIEHLRLCGDIPESYAHDSTEEKLYSKYTDCLLSEAYKSLGLQSIVLSERADAADVEAFAKEFSFVADAKAFRLSRTAKNQKDFKVQAMDGWKYGKPYAMVVCPIYQLPTKSSQIYQQATTRNVCIFTYSHLCMLVQFAGIEGTDRAEELLQEIFLVIAGLNPSKENYAYWLAVNRTMLAFSESISALWDAEKQAAVESIELAKEEALTYLATVRERMVRMSHEEAIQELLRVHRIESRIKIISGVTSNNILAIA